MCWVSAGAACCAPTESRIYGGSAANGPRKAKEPARRRRYERQQRKSKAQVKSLRSEDPFLCQGKPELHEPFAQLALAACHSVIFLVDCSFSNAERDSLASAQNNRFQVASQSQGEIRPAVRIEGAR